jgi:hypothetical protein
MMVGEGKLHLSLIDCENVAEPRSLKLLEESSHAREDLLEQIQGSVQHMEDYCL